MIRIWVQENDTDSRDPDPQHWLLLTFVVYADPLELDTHTSGSVVGAHAVSPHHRLRDIETLISRGSVARSVTIFSLSRIEPFKDYD